MATSVRELITGALRLINVIQANETPSEDDMSVALSAFDAMIQSWSNDSLMIYSINPYLFNTVGGQQNYTMGPGGDWNIDRPMEIKQAYVVWNTGAQAVDLPIILCNDAQFASIAVKSTPSTFPFALYDNGNYPLKTITVWPIPTVPTPIRFWLHQPLVDFSNLDAQVQYPPGYERAFRFNLACEVAVEWGKEVSEMVMHTAGESKKEIAKLNAVPQYMSGDGAMGQERQRWNWITGNFSGWGRY